MLRHVPYIQRQHGTLCLIHEINNMSQHPRMHLSELYSAFPPGQALQGDYHVHELSRALHHISPHIPLIEGQPHMGATDNADLLATVRGQPHEHPLLDFAILTIHPDQRAPGARRGAHHVAAVLLPLRTATPEWRVLDSCRPDMVFPLPDLRNAQSFDADVSYVECRWKEAHPSHGTRTTARLDILRHMAPLRHRRCGQQSPVPRGCMPTPSQGRLAGCAGGAVQPPPPPAWGGAPPTNGGSAQPVQVRFFLHRRYTACGTIDRDVVLAECRRGGLHGVAYGSYTQETVGTHPAAAGGGFDLMYRLTLHVNTHSAQVQSRPQSFRQEGRRVLHGAHAVVLRHEQSVTVQRTSRTRAPANYTDRHSFLQHRRQRGYRTHSREPLACHALHVSNAFSRLSDITTEHPTALQHSMAPPVAGSEAGLTGPATSSDERSPTALGRPHTTRTRCMRSRIHDRDYIGTLNTRNLNTCSMAAIRVGALSHMMQAHCVGIMAVQETKLMGHLREFNEFGVQRQGRPRWRRSQQPSRGHVSPRHSGRARLWPEHMRHLRLNGRGQGTVPTGWGMNSRSTKCVAA